MPWKISEVEELRWKFICACMRRKVTMREVCRCFGISRQCGHKWWRRFQVAGRRGLGARSRRPTSAQVLQQRWHGRVLALRRSVPDFGPDKLCWQLRRQYRRGPWPAARTVARWLALAKLVRRRVRRARPGPRIEPLASVPALRANDVWTVDFKGWFYTTNGRRVCALTVRDLASRYILAVRHVQPATEPPVAAILRSLFRRHGLPRAIKTDNGAPFGGPGPRGWTALSAAWIRLGIKVEFGRPACPQDNGEHEQMHQVLQAATARPPSLTLEAQQRRFDRWRWRYNHRRPHAALGMQLPATFYRPTRRRLSPPPWHYPHAWAQVRPDAKGRIRRNRRQRLLGQAFAGALLGLKPSMAGVLEVYFGPHLLGTLHDTDSAGLRPVCWRNPSFRNGRGTAPPAPSPSI